MGADFVEKVLDELRPHRIEHGVRAIENMKTVERLKRENIALDMCPISNLKLGVKGVPTLAQHPIRPLFDAGVSVTLSTDDPAIFGNHLNDEYMALYEHMHFTKKELLEVAANGFRVALLAEDIRQKYLAEIAEMAAQVQE
jgi:adenosine deaminase